MQNLTLGIIISLATAWTAVAAEKLPDDIKWLTNDTDPTWGDPGAKKGGTYRDYMLSYPITFRYVGPDSNGGFRQYILGNSLALVAFHPNTDSVIPQIASHWAYSDDNKITYLKLNPKARWSDGKPVTAADFAFTLEFMRSKNIVAPWYNEWYTKNFNRIIIYDKHTMAVVLNEPKPRDDLAYYSNLSPTPRHFYKGKIPKDWVKQFNWKIQPNTGPYYIDSFKKGKSITFKRKKNWWGYDLRFSKGLYNVDKVIFKVIRDDAVAWKQFLKGKFDSFAITRPSMWHDKAKGEDFDRGYIKKVWFYNDAPQSSVGIFMNMDKSFLGDKNVRLGLAHSTNFKKVIDKILRGDYQRLDHGYLGYGDYTDTTIKALEFDLAKADHYFKKAGFTSRGPDGIRVKDGKRLSFTMQYPFEPLTPRFVVLKEEWKKAGVEVNLKLLDSSAAFKSLLEKKHELAYSAWGTSFRPQFWGTRHSVNAHKPQTNNITATDNKELDKVIDAYRVATTRDERIKLAKKAQQLIHAETSLIPSFSVPYYRVAHWAYWRLPKIPGTKKTDGTPFYFFDGLFWLDRDAKKAVAKARKAGKPFGQAVHIDTTYKR